MTDLVITHLTHPWGPSWTLETLGNPWRPLATWLKMTNIPQFWQCQDFGNIWSPISSLKRCKFIRAIHWNGLCTTQCYERNTIHRNGFEEVQFCCLLMNWTFWWFIHLIIFVQIFQAKKSACDIFCVFLQLRNQFYLTPVQTWEFLGHVGLFPPRLLSASHRPFNRLPSLW